MKQIIIILLCIFGLSLNQSFSQTITNGDFESWTDGEPDGWDTSNDDIAVFGQTVVEEYTDDPFSGTSAVYLESKSMGPFVMSGIIVNGNYELSQTQVETIQGSAFTERPEKMKFAYKCAPEAGDNCVISITLLNNSDTVASGFFSSSDLVEVWTEQEIILNYISTDIPDTMVILIMSSLQNSGSGGVGAVAGSKLWVDNLTLENSSSVQSIDYHNESFVYPNPSSGIINVKNSMFGITDSKVKIFNALGSIVYETNENELEQSIYSIDISGFHPGIYLVQIISDNKKLTQKVLLK